MRFIHLVLVTFFLGITAFFWFFPTVTKKALKLKPSLYLIPDYKQGAYLVESFPKHNQFLAATPTVVILKFDKDIQPFTGSVKFKETDIHKNIYLDGTKKILTFPLNSVSDNGIYKVMYQVCFAAEECTTGQFAYKVDIATMSSFSNFTDLPANEVVVVKVTPRGLDSNNILIDAGTQVRWVSEDGNPLEISGSTFSFVVAKESSDSDVLGVTSDTQTFSVPGEYIYTVSTNPSFVGRILVQK